MRAIVDATEFSQALNKVIKVVKRSQIPVLEGVLVQIKGGTCTLTATDWTTWLTTAIPAQGDALAFVLQRMRDKTPSHYYTDVLVENGRTLKDFLDRR